MRVRDEHLVALTEFFRKTWDPSAGVEGVRASRAAHAAVNPHGPGVDIPTFLFLRNGEAVGHLGTIPVRLVVHGRVVDAHWLKGLMVLPEHQGGPVGFLLVKHATRELGWAMALVVKPEARRLFTALGFSTPGALVDSLRILDAGAIASMDVSRLGPAGGRMAAGLSALQRLRIAHLAGAAAGGIVNLWSAAAGRGSGSTRKGSVADFGAPALNGLWTRAKGTFAVGLVRDAHYLVHRYPPEEYVAALASDAQGPSALVLVRRPSASGDPRLAGIRVATLSDLLAVDASSALAAIAAAEELARDLGAQALLCAASHPRLRKWLRRRAFVPLGARVHLLVRPADAAAVPAIDDWWLLRGDSSADEVF